MRHHSTYKLLRVFIACFILSCSINLSAQDNFRFEHFTTENGLSENYVYSIIQDRKGYLWIGTHDGLNRYDGYSFKKFRHNPADSNSLPDNTINSICEDGQGNIWLATNGGLCRYEPEKNRFSKFSLLSKVLDVQQVLTINEKELLVKHGAGISHVNIENLKDIAVPYQHKGSLNVHISTYNYILTKNKREEIFSAFLFGDALYVWQFDNQGKNFIEKASVELNLKNKKYVNGIFYADKKNYRWFGIMGSELGRFSLSEKIKAGDITKLKPNSANRTAIFEDQQGNIWIATNVGLYFYDYATGFTKRYQHDNSPGAISSDIVNAVYQDRTGIIWIATSNGLNKLNPGQRKFSHLTESQEKAPALFNNFVLGIYPENDKQVRIHYNFWKGYFSRFNIANNSIVHLSVESYDYKSWIKETLVKEPGLLSDSLLKLIADSLKKFSYSSGKPWGFLFIDKRLGPWFVAGGSLFNLLSGKSQDFKFSIADAKLKDDEIWLATAGDGLACFNTGTRKMVKYVSGDSRENSIISNDITSLIPEDDGNIWIGTKGGGLNYFNHQKKTFQHYTEEDGLCNNSIYCMVKDGNGNIWIGTSNGLSCFNPVSKKFRNYFRADGLVNTEYNRQSACKLADGTIFMGGMNGVDYFHPDSLTANTQSPQILVTDFKVFNKSAEPGKNLSLNHTENFITLEFAAMDFSNPSGNKFKYKMEGVDPDWVLLENRNFTTYSFLKPGSYHFLVKGANSDGVWNEEPAVYNFTILPPWYQTWWFRIMAGFLVIGSVFLAVRFYINRKLGKQKTQLEKQKVIELERMRISTELHDDIGGELSAIRLLSEMNISTISPQQQLSKISLSSGELVQKMNEIVWALNVNNDTLQGLIAYIRRYAVKHLDDIGIDCSFKQPDKIPGIEVDGITRRNIFLLVKEALNNVVKHANATEVKMSVTVDDSLQIIIHDNGKGIPADKLQNGSGNGLRNMQQRVKELKGVLEIKNLEGTTIQFNLPVPGTNTKR